MSDRLIHQPASPEFDVPVIKRRRSRIFVVFAIAGILLLLFLGYTQTESFGRRLLASFEATSDGLVISAESFRLVGTKRLVGSDLTIIENDGTALFQCQRLDLKFDVVRWLRGSLSLKSVLLEGAQLEVFESGDGKKSLGTLWAKFSKKKTKSHLPLRGVEVSAIELRDCLVRFTWEERPETLIEVQLESVASDLFAPGRDCNLSLETVTRFQSDGNSSVTMRSAGNVNFNLRESGLPKSASMRLPLRFIQGDGHFQGLEEVSGELDLSIDPRSIKESGLRFSRAGEPLGSILFSGPFDSEKLEGRIGIKTSPLTRPLLNLFFTVSGVDFGASVIQSDMTADWAFGGSILSVRGNIEGSTVELIKGDARTPKTEVLGDYSFQFNKPDETLLIQKLQLTAASGGTNWFEGKLGSPVFISWGDVRPGIREPVFNLSVKHLDAHAWGTFFLLDLPRGEFSLDATTTVQRDGQKILSNIKLDASDLEVRTPDGHSMLTDLEITLDAQIEELKRLSVLDLEYSWLTNEQDFVEGNGVAAYSLDDGSYSFQLVTQGPVSALAERSGIAGLRFSNGALNTMLRVQSKGDSYDVTFNASASNLVGRYRRAVFDDHRFEFQMDSKVNGSAVSLKSLTANARKGYTGAGSLGFSGDYDLKSESGDIRFRATGINRFLFSEMLDEYVKSELLDDAVLRSEGRVLLNLGGESRITGKVSIDQWQGLSQDGETNIPLDVELAGNGVFSQAGLMVRDGIVGFSSTKRFSGSKNELQFELDILDLEGVELSSAEIRSEKLDLSPYLRWIRNSKPDQVSGRVQEPGSEALRSSGFWPVSLDVEFGELYLDPLAATNLVVRSSIQKDSFKLEKLDAAINGGSISGVGTVGHRDFGKESQSTDVAIDLALSEIPIELWQGVVSGEAEEGVTGRLNLRAQIDGRIEESSENESALTGQIEATLTDPTFPAVATDSLPWLTPILTSLRLPDPDTLEVEQLSTSVSFDKNRMIVEDLSLDANHLRLKSLGAVLIKGGLEATPVDLPVEVLLNEQVMKSAGLLKWATPKNAFGFYPIPQFLSLEGTLAEPRFAMDQLALANLVIAARADGDSPDDESVESE